MPLSLKMVAQEIFMCGLRQVPILGSAIEVVDNIQKRHALLQQQDRLARVEQELTSFDRRMRGLVQEEIQGTIVGLSQQDLSERTFTTHIKNLLNIKQNGWSPALFQGLLERSVYWNELCNNPSHYGRILGDRDPLDPAQLQVFIDADKTRVLELTPIALHALLARQIAEVSRTEMVASTDVWALKRNLPVTDTIANSPASPLPNHLKNGRLIVKRKKESYDEAPDEVISIRTRPSDSEDRKDQWTRQALLDPGEKETIYLKEGSYIVRAKVDDGTGEPDKTDVMVQIAANTIVNLVTYVLGGDNLSVYLEHKD